MNTSIVTETQTFSGNPEQNVFTQCHELLKIQGTSGNWDYEPYQLGFFNGMELILSIFENRNPDYKNPPKKWLKKVE